MFQTYPWDLHVVLHGHAPSWHPGPARVIDVRCDGLSHDWGGQKSAKYYLTSDRSSAGHQLSAWLQPLTGFFCTSGRILGSRCVYTPNTARWNPIDKSLPSPQSSLPLMSLPRQGVCDAGPTINQNWVNVSCLLGLHTQPIQVIEPRLA